MSFPSLSGKVALITGASAGIGREIAELFAKNGMYLSLTGRNAEKLSETREKCSMSPGILITQADVNDDQAMNALVEATFTKFGKIDVLVNNAGILAYGSIESTTLDQFDQVMNTNVRSLFHLSNLCVPHLIKSKGNIVNISSVNGIRAFPNVLAYCVSKAAVDQLTRCCAIELSAQGIRVNAVNPGVITTGIQEKAGLSAEAYKNFLEHSKTTHALGRVGAVEEVASAVAFLASDQASFITGTTLPVDGGRHALCPR